MINHARSIDYVQKVVSYVRIKRTTDNHRDNTQLREDILRDIGGRDDAAIDLAEGALALAAF